MREKDYNTKYCGVSIVIRNNKGVARIGRDILNEIDFMENDKIYEQLILFIDQKISEQWEEDPNCPDMDEGVLKALQQQIDKFQIRIKDAIKTHEEICNEKCFISFEIIGNVKEGKLIKPNYKIASEDGSYSKTYHYSGKEYVKKSGFNADNMTKALSFECVGKIWELKPL